MTPPNDEMDDLLQEVYQQISAEFPEIAEFVDGLSKEDLHQNTERLLKLISENPEIEEQLLFLFRSRFSNREQLTQEPSGELSYELTPLQEKMEDLFGKLIIPSPGKGKRPQLNPLYEAAIIERVQFDGDVPELRTGPLGTAPPAIPVQTMARSLVAVGAQLVDASEDMAARIEEHEQKRLERLNESTGKELVTLDGNSLTLWAKEKEGSPATDLPEYRRGSLPTPVKATPKTGSELAQMDKDTSRYFAGKALSTTQGRRSIAPVIEQQVLAGLEGWDISSGKQNRDPDFSFFWTTALNKEKNPNFAYVDVAAKVLQGKALKALAQEGSYHLEVTPYNNIPDREVGWQARIWLK